MIQDLLFTVALTLHSLTTATPVAEPQTTVVGAVTGLASDVTGTVGGLVTGGVGAANATVGTLGKVIGNILAPLASVLNDTLTALGTLPTPILKFIGLSV